MSLGNLFNRFVHKRTPENVSGVNILLLERHLQRFTTEQLNVAMQKGWRREHDPVTFFATTVNGGDGAVIKFNSMFITMQHFDHRLDSAALADRELPSWAEHSAYSSLLYGCPGGIPPGDIREQFYGFLGLLCAELLSDNVVALFFNEERILIPNTIPLVSQLRSGNSVSPAQLAE